MKISVRQWAIGVLVGTLWVSSTGPAQGQSGDQAQNSPRPIVRTATRTDLSAPLRDLPELPPKPAVLGEIFERPRKLLPNREGSTAAPAPDPVLQAPISEPGLATKGPDFEGVGNVNGVLPPDTNGDIGPDHYVQMVNLSFAIWNRSGNLIYGPVNNKTLWQGFGGPCERRNDGDPVVLYDHLADRWLMSQFALPRFPQGPFYQCIAVSQTGNPLGAWHRYEFLISQSKLNDYPKFGVWPDGYYMSVNQFSCSIFGCSWGGQGVVAFERDKMLAGDQGAQMVYFDLYTTDSNLGGMLPSDVDGPAPATPEPNHFAEIDDNAWGYSPADQIQIWDFHVDWSNPGSSTFTKWGAFNTAAFDSNLCGYARNCIPQGNTTYKVDAISDRLMYRLQYRKFEDHQTLMLNHTVDVNGSDRAGIRWYELRNSGSGWSIHQQGTFSDPPGVPPDGNHRWMGSIAMNQMGDVGLGYSVSGSGTYPSIRATGRLAGDAAGTMTQGEVNIVAGSGYQTHSSGRWGDYSSMSVDPVDDCTFWYTQEYYAVAGNAPWQTRIGSFTIGDCGTPPLDFSIATSPSSQTITQGGSTSYDITVSSLNGYSNSVTLSVDSGCPPSASCTFSPDSVVTGGNGSRTLNVTTTGTTTTGNYSLVVKGTDGTLTHTTTASLTVNAPAAGDFSISASPGSLTLKSGQSGSYTVAITPSNGFNSDVTVTANCPTGFTCGFANGGLIPGGNGTDTYSVTNVSAPRRTSATIIFNASGGGQSHSTSVGLKSR